MTKQALPSQNGAFRVEIPQNLWGKMLKVDIYNLQGQMIRTVEVKTEGDLPVFLENKGVFVIIITENEYVYITKVIVE